MAQPTKTGYNDAKDTLQYMENNSYDQTFKVLTREMLTFNPVANQLERMSTVGQGNASLALTYTDGNVTTIEKTVSGTTYTKTITYTDGNVTAVSAWS